MRGKVLGIRSIIDRYKIGDIKNSIGNGEVKELICTTHGHELRGMECWWEGWCKVEEGKREKMDNCNSIINKIYLK